MRERLVALNWVVLFDFKVCLAEDLLYMTVLSRPIALRTNRDDAVVRLSQIEKFTDGSGYGCQLFVKSGSFTYDGSFYFDNNQLQTAVAALREMDANLSGEAVLKGTWEEDHIRIAVNEMGHVIVSGALFLQSDLPQALKFMFKTDQSVIKPFLDDLGSLLTA